MVRLLSCRFLKEKAVIEFVTVIFLIVTFLMVVAILMQSTKGGGLGAGFNALGGTQVFGGRGPSDILKKFTTIAGILYGVLTIILAGLHSSKAGNVENNALINDTQNAVQTAPATDQFADPTAVEPVQSDSTN
jgi:preprotein translocase subunit SecG